MNRFQISLSYVFDDKEPINGLSKDQAFGTPTPATLVTPQELFEHITSGKTFVVGTYQEDRKHKTRFIQSQTLWLDLDDNTSIVDCLQIPFIRDNAFMLYSSGTSSHEHYKTRVGFQLDKPITDSAEYERIILALFEVCKPLISDSACKDSARLFYGSTNRTEEPIVKPDIITSLANLENLANDLDIHKQEQRTEEMDILIRTANTRRMKSDSTALEAYANKALDNMVSELSSMSEGGRNNTAFKFGASMGNMASAGMIDAMVAESALIGAALASGLSHFESQAVSRGMARGMQTPFDTSKLKTQKENKIVVDKTFKERKVELKVIEEKLIEQDLYDSELLPGGRKSWINQDRLPKAWIQAALTLSDTRSGVTTLLIQLHESFRTGALNPNNFTLKQIRDTIYDGKRRPSTKAALDTLSAWALVRDNGAYSIYKELPNYPLQYAITSNISLINYSFLDMLDRYIIENHTSKTLAPRMHTLFHELDLSLEDAKVWSKRCDGLVSNETLFKIKSDMRYWLEMITDDNRYTELAYQVDCDNVQLRALLLSDYLHTQKDNQIQMSQDEIMRLCGLKSASFKAIFKEAGITTDLRYKFHSVKNPNTCNLEQELQAATQAKNNDGRGGHLVWMNIKPVGGKYSKPIYKRHKMIEEWSKLKSRDGQAEDEGMVFGISIRVQLPSLVRFKTDNEIEIEIEAAKQKELEALEDNSDIAIAPSVAKESVQDAPKPRKKARYSTRQDRSWDKHDKKWLYTQLQAEVYTWLNQELLNGGLVRDANKEPIATLQTNTDIIRYINEQIILRDIDKPYHVIEKFFDSEPLDFEIEDVKSMAEKIEKSVPKIEPTVKKIKKTKRRLTLAETRAWGKATDKVEYLQSIGAS